VIVDIGEGVDVTLLVSRSHVHKALGIVDAIRLVERGFIQFGQGGMDMPQRAVIFAPEHNGLARFMPALLRDMGALSIKTVTAFKDNPI
jgi:ornithine cyclodeaminase/alanine dehydrogenase-like protein (mu-crystallin family)